MLFILTILATSYTLSLAAPGPCPTVNLANVTDPAKLGGRWIEPWMSWPQNVSLTIKCNNVTLSGWNPATGTFSWTGNVALMNNTKEAVSGTMKRTANNATWEITVNGHTQKSTAVVLDYVEDKYAFYFTCIEENGGKNHTELAYVYTRDLKDYWSYWLRMFLTVLANKLQYLNMVGIPYNDCPK